MKLSIKLSIGLIVVLLGLLLFQAIISNKEIGNAKLRNEAQSPEILHKILTSGPKLYNAASCPAFTSIRIQCPVAFTILKGDKYELFIKGSQLKDFVYEVKNNELIIKAQKNEGMHIPIYIYMPEAPINVYFDEHKPESDYHYSFCNIYGFNNSEVQFLNDSKYRINLDTDLPRIRIQQGQYLSYCMITSKSMDSTARINRVDLVGNAKNGEIRYVNRVADLFNLDLQLAAGSFDISNSKDYQKAGTIKISGTTNSLRKAEDDLNHRRESHINIGQVDSLMINLSGKDFYKLHINKSVIAKFESIQCDSTVSIER